MNFFSDNPDLQFQFNEAVRWEGFVSLWEEGFGCADGPRSLAEAREVYDAALRELGEFTAREIAPRAREIDEQGVGFRDGEVVHPPALLRNIEGLKALGVMAVSLPRALGGFNFPFTVSAACLELVGRACTNTMILYGFHQGPALMLQRFGTPAQVERWVPRLAAGEISGSVAMTEPEAGSDLGKIAALAVDDGAGGFRLDGRKQFITNGCGEVCLVLARSEPGSQGLDGLSLLAVPRHDGGRANYRVARPEKKYTIRGSATCELHFDGSRAELVGERGQGFRHMLTFMNEARVAVAVQALGLCEDALHLARAYAARRVQMGRPIARHPMVAEMLLDMQAEVAALRALVYACTQLQDRLTGLARAGLAPAGEVARLKRELRECTPLVKWLGAERALQVTRTAVQVHGGYGVVQDYDVERLYRNALILPIYEGTSQIQALMSLKDQMRFALRRPLRLLGGAVRVRAPHDTLGDALREMAGEYNRALRTLVARGLGLPGLFAVLRRRPGDLDAARLDAALLHAERLVEMLAVTRAAEALLDGAGPGSARRRLAEHYVHRALPRVRMLGEGVRRGAPERTEVDGAGA